MEALVKEILSAARMGGSDFHLERTDLDISQMLRKVCQQFRGRMEDKQIELRMDIQPEYHYQGDRRLMEKVFTLSLIHIYLPQRSLLSNSFTFFSRSRSIFSI